MVPSALSLWLFLTWMDGIVHAQETCKTEGGAECKFPFQFGDKIYYGCTTEATNGGKPWCSTEVNKKGFHVTGQYGDCAMDNCRTDSAPILSTTRPQCYLERTAFTGTASETYKQDYIFDVYDTPSVTVLVDECVEECGAAPFATVVYPTPDCLNCKITCSCYTGDTVPATKYQGRANSHYFGTCIDTDGSGGTTEPEIVQPEIVQPEIVQPEIVQPEIVQPESCPKSCEDGTVGALPNDKLDENGLCYLSDVEIVSEDGFISNDENTGGLAGCRKNCEDLDGCKAIDYNSERTCTYYGGSIRLVKTDYSSVGPKRCVRPKCYRTFLLYDDGNDIGQPQFAESAEACQTRCETTGGCRFFTYADKTVDFTKLTGIRFGITAGDCFLKSGLEGEPTPVFGVITGPRCCCTT